MCVGLPAKVMTMKDGMAVVDASGAKREVSAEIKRTVSLSQKEKEHAGVSGNQ